MPLPQERTNIAVFIDFDNIEIGVKTTLNEHFDVGAVLDAIKERGEVVTKIAYADWTRAGEYSRTLTQHAIRLVQRNLTPGGDKNGADINLALDALEMAFTHPHINAYVIVGGDSDFLSLVEKLKQYDKKVFVVGGRAFTSVILQRNCHEFIAYENLTSGRRSASRPGRPVAVAASSPIAQAFPIVRRALKILADREVSPQTGLLKSTLLQLDSTFSERNYGASSFLDFAEKLAHAGLVTLKHSGRSVMVELNQGFEESEQPASTESKVQPFPQPHERAHGGSTSDAAAAPAPAATESQADGVRAAAAILSAATSARWPMYLRNVKQILRAHRGADQAGGFDERRYGFAGGLMDILRALQRDGFLRLERDRRGGLRVFQGQALRAGIPSQLPASAPEPTVEVDIEPGETPAVFGIDVIDAEPADIGPMPIDTTAELLGTKPRRVKAGPASSRAKTPRGTRKVASRAPAPAAAAARKLSTRRTARSKKAASEEKPDSSEE